MATENTSNRCLGSWSLGCSLFWSSSVASWSQSHNECCTSHPFGTYAAKFLSWVHHCLLLSFYYHAGTVQANCWPRRQATYSSIYSDGQLWPWKQEPIRTCVPVPSCWAWGIWWGMWCNMYVTRVTVVCVAVAHVNSMLLITQSCHKFSMCMTILSTKRW